MAPEPHTDPFPIAWERPEDRGLWWTWDQVHDPRPLSPLYASIAPYHLRGRQRAHERFGGVTRTEMRLCNGYRYTTQLPLPLSPQELETRQRRGEDEMERALAALWERWTGSYLPEVTGDHARMEDFDLEGASPAELLDHLDWALARWERHQEIHFLAVAPAAIAARRFVQTFAECTGIQDEFAAFRLLQGYENKTEETHRSLWQLAEGARAVAAVRRCFQPASGEAILDELRAEPEAQAFLHNLNAILAAYGGYFTNLGEDFSDPTWREAPGHVLLLVKHHVEGETPDLRERMAALAQEREQAIQEAYRLIGAAEEKRRRLTRDLGRARYHLPIMEDHHFAIDQLSQAYLRWIFLEFGRRLSQGGSLPRPRDVMFLSLDEVQEAIQSPTVLPLTARVEERRQQREQWLRLSPPPGVGTPPYSSQSPPSDHPLELKQEPGKSLKGLATSPGRVRGSARVVLSPEELSRVRAGDILVCQSMLPQWTPLFSLVGGLVTNAGATLMHGAILAREYRIPAVEGTQVATRAIQDGQLITVDGTAGVVYLEEG